MTEPTPDGWNPCPPGELGRLSALLTFRRRLRSAAWGALALAAVAGVAGAARLAYPVIWASPAEPSPAGCHTAPVEEPPPPVCNHEETPADKKK
jgi:hypothetical protein